MITTTGHFEGKITIGNDSYYLERSHHHLTEPHGFHTVIYKESDVTFNPSESICGVEKLYDGKRNFQSDDNIEVSTDQNEQFENWQLRYRNGNGKHQLNSSPGDNERFGDHHRNRRAVDPTKVTCEMYMQADHLYYRRYYNDTDTVIEKLTQHVQAINNIFPTVGK